MKIFVPPLDITQINGFTQDGDIFQRREFGEAILEVIKNTDNPLVLALDAPWGEGKTTFIKMWEGLLDEHENNIEHIYFDAFENDYQNDPFLAITSELYQLIKHDKVIRETFKERSGAVFKAISRASLRIGIKAATAGVLDDSVLDISDIENDTSQEAAKLLDDYINSRLDKAKEDKDSIEHFKTMLGSLKKELGANKIIFIIDELDRCKPSFALALLEKIKHLFSSESITFLLVMNRAQMEEAVKHEYGMGVNATKYLQKFVSLWLNFPIPRKEMQGNIDKYVRYCLNNMGYGRSVPAETAFDNIVSLSEHFNLSLRDIEKALSNFAIIQNARGGTTYEVDILISVFISIIKVVHPEAYSKLKRNQISYDELISDYNLSGLKQDKWETEREEHPIRWLLKAILADDKELEKMGEKHSLLSQDSFINLRKYYIEDYCRYLDSFKRD